MSADFLDEARIFVAGGKGGDGSVHFRREKFVPNGGPDGGDGGDGGSVILRADRGLNTLQPFRYQRHFVAGAGEAGSSNRRHGKNGMDVVVPVPVGTLVRDAGTGEDLGDLTTAGNTLTVARGGQGGLGNTHFATSTNQAPSFAEKGDPGEERGLMLELKLVADVGLIGLPNAGKSTLLSVISAARPKIADYPFTTLVPNLGVVSYDDYSFVAADIPGLIEGAHRGVGLGDQFLRHIERTLVLVHVVDGSAVDVLADFAQVNAELHAYDPHMDTKPQIVAYNKIDIPEARDRWPEMRMRFAAEGYRAYPISAATREGVDELVAVVSGILVEQQRELTERAQAEESESAFVFTERPDPDRFTVFRKRKTYHVEGETVERLARMTDLSSDEAVNRLQRRLQRMGVLRALEREGVGPGDRVLIGNVELIWEGAFEAEPTPASRSSRRRTP